MFEGFQHKCHQVAMVVSKSIFFIHVTFSFLSICLCLLMRLGQITQLYSKGFDRLSPPSSFALVLLKQSNMSPTVDGEPNGDALRAADGVLHCAGIDVVIGHQDA